tara:strand:+ start:4043 stop:4561 length:519 start_codon:yes stop_codon:yes gene_type:complete
MSTSNFLSPVEFKLVINRLPNTEFYVQQANVPGLNSGYAERPTPFKNIYTPGDKLIFDDLNITLVADENLASFRECSDWLTAIARAEGFEGYAGLNSPTVGGATNLSSDGKGSMSDASLIILDSNKNANIQISFKDIFPISIGPIQLNTSDSDVVPPTFDVTFKYSSYTITL